MPERRYFHIYDEFRTTNLHTATERVKKLRAEWEECLESNKPERVHTYDIKTTNKAHLSDVVRKEYPINFDKLTKIQEIENSLEFQFMQVASEFETILLDMDLPVDVNVKYANKCDYREKYSADTWREIVYDQESRIYGSLQKCIDIEMSIDDPLAKELVRTAINGLERMKDARKRILLGNYEFACVAILQAAIELKTLELLKTQKERLVGRSQILSGRSNTATNENTGRPSLSKYIEEPMQKEIDNYLREHSSASDNQVFRHVVQKFNKETCEKYISNPDIKYKELTISTLKSWKRKKLIKTK